MFEIFNTRDGKACILCRKSLVNYGFKKIMVACMSLRGKANDFANFNLNLKNSPPRALKKKTEIFLIYKEIRMGSVAKSYMRKGFLIYEEMRNEEAVSHI